MVINMSNADERNIGLPQDERERIRAEEIFREEVREQLAATTGPQKLHQRLWASRNSAFTLWLLSSVVLAAISWSYAQWESARSLQRRAELDYREFAAQAADAVDELQGAIMAHRSSVDQHMQENIRRLGRFYHRCAMMKDIEASAKATASVQTSLEEVRGRMEKARRAAEGIFQLWVEFAVGDDVNARKKWLEDWNKHKKGQDEDVAQALAQEGEEQFFLLIEQAIRWKVLLQTEVLPVVKIKFLGL